MRLSIGSHTVFVVTVCTSSELMLLSTSARASVEKVRTGFCRDVCTGVFAYKLVEARLSSGSTDLDEAAAVDAFAWGLAAACARCEHDLPEAATMEEVASMRARIRVEENPRD